MKLDGQEFDARFYFSVSLKSTVEGTKAAGKLEVIKEGAQTLSGAFGDAAKHNFVPCCGFKQNCGLKYDMSGYEGRGELRAAEGYFTSGSTCLLNLVATITIPGKLTSLGGGAEEEMKQNRLMDFQHLLTSPKHSDIVLKCGDTSFLCHKVILASR